MSVVDKPIGIDLGTTNSAVALMNSTDSEIEVYRDRYGRLTMPSCVAVESRTGEVIVGRRAYNYRGHPSAPEPITSIKRRMGFPGRVRLGDEEKTPVEISALILRELVQRIEEHLADKGDFLVRRAVITVPAYFNVDQMIATREAGELAGLEVLELLHEPTASAMYNAWLDGTENAVYMVYDLGGGTFDVSIIQKIGREFKTLGIAGNNFLGGDDFDRAVVNQVMVPRLQEMGYDVEFELDDPHQRWKQTKLVALAESVKIALSKEAVDYYPLEEPTPLFDDKRGEPVYLNMEISRQDLVGAIEDKVRSTLPKCYEALERSGLDIGRVDKVALVGGSTLIPYVQQMVAHELLEGDVSKLVAPMPRDPTTCVAMGAAIKAATYGTTYQASGGRFQIALKSYSGTREARHTVHGRLVSVDEGLDLAEAQVEILARAGGFNAETEVRKDGRFSFRGVPLAQEASNTFDLVVRGPRAEEVGRVPITVLHSSAYRPLPTELGGGEPLGKAWRLEVLSREGRLKKTDLLPVGTPIPAMRTHEFVTTDQSGRVRLALFEEDRLIREILVQVPTSLPPGSPVRLSIRCDEKYFVTVDGSIPNAPGAEFHATIEPPPPPPEPTPEQVEMLREEFEAAIAYISNPDRQGRLMAEFSAIYSDLQEAFRNRDEPKLRQRVAELEGLLARAAEPEPEVRLEPPKAEFDRLVRGLSTQLLMVTLLGLQVPNLDQVREAVEVQRQLGEQAYADKDAAGYADAFRALLTLYRLLQQSLQGEEPGGGRSIPDPVTQARGMVVELRRQHQRLAQDPGLVQPPTWQGAQAWLQEVRTELQDTDQAIRTLEPLVAQEPESVIRQAQALRHRLDVLEQRLELGPPPAPEAPEGTVGERGALGR